MKSAPSGTTYQVDGHVTGTCHRSVQCIVTNPTCVSFNDSFPAPIITPNTLSPPISHNINSLGNRWIPPQPSQFEAQFNWTEVLKRKKSKTVVHSARPTISATPHYCHTYKSKQPTSLRTRLPTMYLRQKTILLSQSGLRQQYHRTHKKNEKIDGKVFIDICLPSDGVRLWTKTEIEATQLVVDGGDVTNPRLEKPVSQTEHDLPWHSLNVCHGDLKIVDTKNASRGLVCRGDKNVPIFLRVPRKVALSISKMDQLPVSNRFCQSLCDGFNVQRTTLFRGKERIVYSQYKYCTMGTQPCRAEPGVRAYTYHMEKMPKESWDNIVETLAKVERIMSTFVPSDELRLLNLGRELLGYKTMTPTVTTDNEKKLTLPLKIFGGVAFGYQVHNAIHTDEDFSRSVVTVHVDNLQYRYLSRVVAYFCFPRIGIAVALRPGDIIIFNAQEPHAVSSRCRSDDNVFCVSMYLKTAVVGLNDNSTDLTPMQQSLFDNFN